MKPYTTMVNTTSPTIKKCLHCQQSFYGDNQTDYCCQGCKAVSEFLKEEGLQHYYHVLKTLGENPQKQDKLLPDYNAFDTESMKELFRVHDGVYRFFIPDLKCAACIWLLERKLHALDCKATVNLAQKTLTVSFVEGEVPLSFIAAQLAQSGYAPYPPRFSLDKSFQSERARTRMKELAVAGAVFGNVMLFSAGVYFGDIMGMSESFRSAFVYTNAALVLPALVYSGRSFFRNAWISLKQKTLHIDLPIVVALLAALFLSYYQMFNGSSEVYFDSISGLVFLLLSGRAFFETLLERAKNLTENVLDLLPPGFKNLKKDDVIWVASGQVVPADGELIEGVAELNCSILNGESLPVALEKGSKVFAGTQNISQPFQMRVEKSGESTYLASLQNQLNQVVAQKTRYEDMASRIVPFFILFTMISSALTFLYWYFMQNNIQQAILYTVALLIVCCPCALALTIPLFHSMALKRLWEKGIWIKDPHVLEKLIQIKSVFLDKTGTLTQGKFKLTKTQGNALSARALARHSMHPLARCIADGFLSFDRIEEIPGRGLKAYHENRLVLLGSAAWIREHDPLALLPLDAQLHGGYTGNYASFWCEDELREGAFEFIQSLKRNNYQVMMLSGDSFDSCQKTAEFLKMPFKYGLSPQEKLDFVKKNNHALMIGDGVNDAMSLKEAYVSLSFKGSVDLALFHSDIVMQGEKLDYIFSLIEYSKYLYNHLKLILIFNFLYNVVAVGLAAMGYIHPLIAALIMPSASISTLIYAWSVKGEKFWKSSSSSYPLHCSLPV